MGKYDMTSAITREQDEIRALVCIPVYNGEPYIANAIDSVKRQSYSRWNCIVTEDCSKDSTPTSIQNATRDDKRFQVSYNPRNLGMVKNWNKALSIALALPKTVERQQDVISILHADDYYHPSFLERVTNYFRHNPGLGMVFTANYEVDSMGEIFWLNKPLEKDANLSMGFFTQLMRSKSNFVRFPAVVVRKEVYEHLGLFDENFTLTVDVEMWLRILTYYSVGYIAEPLCYYRVHSTNDSRKYLANGTEILELEKAYTTTLSRLGTLKNTDVEAETVEKNLWKSMDRRVFNWRYIIVILRVGGHTAVSSLTRNYRSFRERHRNGTVSPMAITTLSTLEFLFRTIPHLDKAIVASYDTLRAIKKVLFKMRY